jgi:hypothetical protein
MINICYNHSCLCLSSIYVCHNCHMVWHWQIYSLVRVFYTKCSNGHVMSDFLPACLISETTALEINKAPKMKRIQFFGATIKYTNKTHTHTHTHTHIYIYIYIYIPRRPLHREGNVLWRQTGLWSTEARVRHRAEGCVALRWWWQCHKRSLRGTRQHPVLCMAATRMGLCCWWLFNYPVLL